MGNKLSNQEQQRNKELEHITFIYDTITKLPDLFAPYIYFGNYKN